MKKYLLLLIVILTLLNCSQAYVYNYKVMSYSDFNKITEKIIKFNISKNFDNVQIAPPLATSYPGKQPDKWAKTNFDVVDDNAAYPKKITSYVIRDNVVCKIDLVYNPQIKQNSYVNVTREGFDEKNKFQLMSNSSPISIVTFSTFGMVIQTTTLSIENRSNIDSKEVITKMTNLESEVIEVIKGALI